MDRKLRILILEDIPTDAELVKKTLRKEKIKFESKVVDKEETYFQGLKDFNPDIILSDYMLPDFNGMDALKLRNEMAPSIPFIIVTGSMNEETAVECLKAGADDYVTKEHLIRLAPAVNNALQNMSNKQERKKAEEAQKESGDRFRTLFEQAADCILLLEILPDGIPVIRDANNSTSRILGYEKYELIGKPVTFLTTHQNDMEPIKERRRKVLSGATVFEDEHQCKDGTTRVFECSVRETRVGSKIFAISVERDITERKQAEEALERSERTLRAIFESARDGILAVDAQTRKFVVANEAICRMLGYSRDEILGLGVNDIHPAEDLPRVTETVERQLKGEISLASDLPMKGKDGSIFYADINSTPVELGGRACLIGVFRDITERKEAEKTLRESEEKYRALFEYAPGSILIFDMAGKVLDANEYFNIPRQLNVGKHFFEMGTIHPDDHEFVKQQFERLIRGEEVGTNELRLFADTPNERWVEVHSALLKKEDKPYAIQTISVDITERKEAEEARAKAQTKIEHLNRVLRAIRDVNQLIVREKNLDSLIQDASQLLVNTRGYNNALFIVTDKSGTPRSYAMAGYGGATHPVPESLKQGRLPPCCDAARLHDGILHIRDRAKVCAPCSMAPDYAQSDTMCIRLKHGETTYGYLTVLVDRSVAIDEDTQSLFSEMAGDIAFALHNIEMEKAMKKAHEDRESAEAQFLQAQKMEAIGRLAGGVAHDFNNILSVILSYSGFLRDEIPSEDPKQDDIHEILEAARRAAELTRQLLAFSRRQVMELQPVNMSDIVDGLRKLLKTLLSEDIDLQFRLDESLGHVMADRGQIEQVIMNLVVNARDAMPRGGKIVIETSNFQLDESFEQQHKTEDKIVPGPYVMLSISDTGEGMTEEVRERVFDPFFTTKDKDKGTGLGLSMVYGIVKQSGGQIFLDSEPGIGSTFKIYLPQTEIGPEMVTEDKKSIPLTGDEIILLVEDDHSMRKAAYRILIRHGYRVIEASNPKEAMEKFEKNAEKIHMLLTDIIMPGGNGRELAEKLREKNPNLKVLFMSGYTDQIISESGLIEGGFNLVMKPFHAEHFLRQIRQILDTPIKH